MSVPDRTDAIRQMLAKTPDDVFLHYSLAMELLSAGACDNAADEFRRCITLDAGYLAAHVELGKTLRMAGRLDEARAAFDRALQLAQTQGQNHTQDYIRQQLEGLPRS